MDHLKILSQLILGEAEILRGHGYDLQAVMRAASQRLRMKPTGDNSKQPPCHPPVHPGEILREEFLCPAGKTASTLEAELGLDDGRLRRLCEGQARVDACTALLLAGALGTTPLFWMMLQQFYETQPDHPPPFHNLSTPTP